MLYLCVWLRLIFIVAISLGVSIQTLQAAPAVAFDRQDFINERFVYDNFGFEMVSEIKHTVGSSEACVLQ